MSQLYEPRTRYCMAAHRSAQGCCKRQVVVHVPKKKKNNSTGACWTKPPPPRHTSKVASMLRCFNLWFAPSSFPVGRWCLENYNYQSKAQREVYVRHNGSHQHAPLDFSVASRSPVSGSYCHLQAFSLAGASWPVPASVLSDCFATTLSTLLRPRLPSPHSSWRAQWRHFCSTRIS